MKFGFKFLTAIYPRFTHESGKIREKQEIEVSKLKRRLCYESQHQSQSNKKSLAQFDYEKAVSKYLGTRSTFNAARTRCYHSGNQPVRDMQMGFCFSV